MQPLSSDDPTCLGPYRLEGRLGAGGMGQVYLGRAPDGSPAAVKVIHPGLAADTQFRARFAREIATARRVSTRWTADVLAADPHAARPWLATEYIPGPSLNEVVTTSGPLAEPAVRLLAAGLAEALAMLHAARVVHRDLKPSNVLLADHGPRLIDFGIARAIDSTTITHTGHAIGTPAFMSPEQALGNDADTSSDVFSLAAVLTYAATGTGPFGHTANAVAMLLRVTQHEPDLAAVPDSLRPMLAECLAKDPAERPTARDLADRLAPPAEEPPVEERQASVEATQPVVAMQVRERPPTLVLPREPRSPTTPLPLPSNGADRGGWYPWMTVLNACLAAVLLVAVLVLVTPGPVTAGPPVPAAETAQPGGRATQIGTLRTEAEIKKVAVSPDGRLAYTWGTGIWLWVIDTSAGVVTGNVALPGVPTDVAFSPDGRRAYVAMLFDSVAVLDTTSGVVLAEVPVGSAPQTVLADPDGGRVYSFSSDRTVSVIDTAGNRVMATFPGVADPGAAAMSPDGRSIYLYDRSTQVVSVLDTATDAVVAAIPAEGLEAIVFSPDGARAHLLHRPGTVTVFDVVNRVPLGEIRGLDLIPKDMAATPDGRHLVVTSEEDEGSLIVIDTATFSIVEQAPVAATRPVGLGLTPDGSRVYVVDEASRTVVVVDISAYRG